jgi:hypothetical protein
MGDTGKQVGQRLFRAFESRGITSKKAIGEALGFKSENAVYKVISGERELSFDSLRRFVQSTGHSIDWLLFGPEAENKSAVPGASLAEQPDEEDIEMVRSLIAEGMADEYEERARELRRRVEKTKRKAS